VLFNPTLEKVVRDIPDPKEMEVIRNHTLLAYADNIILLGESKHEVEEREQEN